MLLDAGEIQEAESDENTGLFFKYIGAFKAPPGEVGTATALQVAPRNGLLVFRTADGPAILPTPPLIKQLRDAREPLELPEPIHQLPGGPTSSIVLSPSGALLAVVAGDTVNVYATAHLAEEGDTNVQPIVRERFQGRTVIQFEFRPGQEWSYVVRLDDKSVRRGSLGQAGVEKLPAAGSDAIAWSPDGSILATAAGRGMLNFLKEGESEFNVVAEFAVKSLELQSEDDWLNIHSIVWLRSHAILISSAVFSGDEPEPVAAACVASWAGEVPVHVSNLKLQELFALNIIPALGQDILRFAAIPDWGAEIYSHASAADDHIKVLLTQLDQDTQALDAVAADIIDDRLAIRVPNGADDADNYVTGLGVDLVGGAGVPIAHPTDPDAPDLPAQPVLWLATSDGCLRAYTFGSIMGRPTIVSDRPIPLPEAPTIKIDEMPGARSTSKPPPSAAVAASVPLEDSDDLEEDEELDYKEAAQAVPSSKGLGAQVTGEDGTSKAIAAKTKAVAESAGFASAFGSSAAPSAPSSSSLPFGGGSTSAWTFGGLAAGVQQTTPATAKPGGLFGGGTSSLTAAAGTVTPGPAGFPTATTPGLFAGLPSTPSVFGPPPPTPNMSGGLAPAAPKETPASTTATAGKPKGPNQPPLPSASQLKAAQALKARVLGSGTLVSDATEVVLEKTSVTTASKPSQPPLPSYAQVKAAQELRGKVLGSSTTSSGSVKQPEKQSAAFGSPSKGGSLFGTGTTAPAVSFPKAQQPPSTMSTAATQPSMTKKKETTIPEPPAVLTGSDTIASGIEAGFLKSLLASRKLETEVHKAVQESLARADEISVGAGALDRCRRGCNEAQHALHEQQQTAAKLTESIKDCLRKTAAMPGFLSEKERQKAGIDGTAPLADPVLALAGSQLQQQLTAARVKLEELTAAVTVLEDRQRIMRLGLEPFDPVKPEKLLELMQMQVEVTARRLEQLEEMKREARRLGLLQFGDEEEEEEEEEDASDGSILNNELSPLTDAMKRLHLPQLGLPASSPSSSRRWSLAEDAAPVSSAVGPAIHQPSYGLVSPGLSAETKSKRLAEACAAARVDGEVRIIDLRGTTAKEGQSRMPTLKQKPVALPAPPRLSPEPGTPKPSFDFTSALGSEAGTVPFFKGLAQEQQLSPMPAAKPKTPSASPSLFSTPPQPKPMPSSGVFAAPLPSPKQPETAKEEIKPKAKASSLSGGSQPPLPSMTQLANARALMSKLPGVETAKPSTQASAAASSVQPSTPGFSTASSQEAKASLAVKKDVSKDVSKDVAKNMPAVSFGALSFGSAASSGTGTTKNAFAFGSSSGPASSAAFGSLFLSSEEQKPGPLSGTNAEVSSSSAASTPFGAFGSSAAASSSSAAATNPFGAFGSSAAASSSSAAATNPFGAFGSSAAASSSSAATTTPFGAFGSTAVASSSSAAASTPFGAFGSTAGASSSGAVANAPFGAFGSSAAASSSSAATTTPFGAFGSTAGASASGAAASAPFGAFGSSAPSSSSTAPSTPFGAFGSSAPSSSSAAPSTPFGAFGSGAGTAAASSPFGAFSKGFGTPSAFGAASTPSSSAAGAAPFGQPTPTAGFGGAIQAGFGQPAAVPSGFGQPAGFGQASAFGTPTAFGGGAASTPAASGFGGGGLAFGKSTTTGGGGFGALAQGGGSSPGGTPTFGSGGQAAPFGGGGFGPFLQPAAPAAFTPPSAGAPNMWAPRK